jgi:hypothetical protein
MIRHGQGTHNLPKGFAKKWRQLTVPDTELTDIGKNQAKKAGEKLRTILVINYKKLVDNNTLKLQTIQESKPEPYDYLHLFVSDLRRTHQTMVSLIAGIIQNTENVTMNITPQAIVLPCSHELEFDKNDGICDSNQPFVQKLASENRTCCRIYDPKSTNKSINPSCKMTTSDDANCLKLSLDGVQSSSNKLNIDWSKYDTFYKKNFSDRAFRYMKSTGPNCSNTSMIAHAIAIINSIDLEYKPLEKSQEQEQKQEQTSQPRKTFRNRLGNFFIKKTMKKNSENEYKTGQGLVGNFVNRLLELK